MFETRMLSVLFMWLLATGVSAHPGHDHTHWSSAWIHGSLLVLVVVAVAMTIFAWRRRRARTVAKAESKG